MSARYLACNCETRVPKALCNADDESGGLRAYTGAYKILRDIARGGRSWGWAAGKAAGRLIMTLIRLGSLSTEKPRPYERSLRTILAGHPILID